MNSFREQNYGWVVGDSKLFGNLDVLVGIDPGHSELEEVPV